MEREITLGEFYEMIGKICMGNNHVYSVKVEMDDGAEKVQMTYISPKGFEQEQEQRQGKLELNV